MTKFLTGCLLALLTLLSTPISSYEREILFLSPYGCGTDWGLYCLSSLLHKQAIFDRGPTEVSVFMNSIPNCDQGYLYAAHNPKDLWIRKNGDDQDILILIIRNYREAMIRHYFTPENVKNELKAQADLNWLDLKHKEFARIQHRDSYFNNLRVYDGWNPKNRFLIYYEDLIDHPQSVLAEILSFLQVESTESVLNDFLDDIDFHSQICMNAYNRLESSNFREDDHLYYSKKIGYETCREIDLQVKELFPYYFDAYLQRYELRRRVDLHRPDKQH